MSFQFFKYSATGNDFILVEDFENLANKNPEFVKKLCNRNFGVGADGVLFVQKKDDKFFMNLINSDGSSAKMCGNGIRIVAKHLFEKKLVTQKTFDILTPTGSKTVSLSIKNDCVSCVVVNMGRAEFIGKKTFFDKSFILLSMGNPHAITFLESFEKAWISKVAPKIESDPFFPDRTNVEFAQILSKNELRLIVFERGAGFTLACGTGACASVASAAKTGLIEFDTKTTVNLPGGKLFITVLADYSVIMEGDATLVFSATADDSIYRIDKTQ